MLPIRTANWSARLSKAMSSRVEMRPPSRELASSESDASGVCGCS